MKPKPERKRFPGISLITGLFLVVLSFVAGRLSREKLPVSVAGILPVRIENIADPADTAKPSDSPGLSDDKPEKGILVERIVSIYDGDTFRADLKNLPPLIGRNIGIRLAGIDTPEIHPKKGTPADREEEKKLAIKARDALRDILGKARVIRLKKARRGKYFRIVAQVYADGRNVTQILLRRKLGYPYNGGKKKSYKVLLPGNSPAPSR